MAETRDEWIKKRAYALWEEEGQPAGRDAIHWEKATGERDALEAASKAGNGKDVKSRAKKATTPKTIVPKTVAPKTAPAKKAVAKAAKGDQAKTPVGIAAPKTTASRKSAS